MTAWTNAGHWLLLESGPGNSAWNMALDETLLEAMPRLLKPVLRFYGWNEPAASFGYFQRFAAIEKLTLLRPLVRRPTGGGLVPHDVDWTYSAAFPTCHEWYAVTATESYRRIHQWIEAGFRRLGISTELASCCRKVEPGQCFAGYEKFDLLWHEKKIAGAAQRRMRSGLLIQGSVQPPPVPLSREAWQMAMVEVASETGAQWSKFAPEPAILKLADELAAQKYAEASYNQKR